ncbi:MAG: type II toxin-antitoxin system VapC family toxin [Bryobacterales bacterium]|nr:type II toxin-antitoxin system VapC family toxin [Bryobacterales bacterium]
MIVVDASLIVELLIRGPLTLTIEQSLADAHHPLIAPHLLDVEVVSSLRNLTASSQVDDYRSQLYLNRLATLPVERRSHTPLLPRMWELRHNFTAYDAAYIALAEATDSILFTCDRKLRRGHRAEVVVFSHVVH